MLTHYYVNKNDEHNPGHDHEVHTEEHALELGIKSKIDLGYFESCHVALEKARQYYSDADGCAICCPECNSG